METNLPSFGVLLFVLRVESASKASPRVSARSSGPSVCSSFDFGAKSRYVNSTPCASSHLSNRRSSARAVDESVAHRLLARARCLRAIAVAQTHLVVDIFYLDALVHPSPRSAARRRARTSSEKTDRWKRSRRLRRASARVSDDVAEARAASNAVKSNFEWTPQPHNSRVSPSSRASCRPTSPPRAPRRRFAFPRASTGVASRARRRARRPNPRPPHRPPHRRRRRLASASSARTRPRVDSSSVSSPRAWGGERRRRVRGAGRLRPG